MSYIGNTPGVSSQRVVLEEVISGSAKSAFTPVSGYNLGYVDVLVNGVEIDSNEFTASDGVTVTLTNAAQVGDTVKIKTWLPRGLSDGYLKSEADAKYVALTGAQTVAGVKTFSSDVIANGLTVGKGAGAVSTNTAVGASALAANTTGTRAVAVGYEALKLNTTGDRNHAFGLGALSANVDGSFNSAVGYATLGSNTSGSNNVAMGYAALNANTTASNNTAVGYQSQYSGQTTNYNTSVGYQSAYSLSSGDEITAVGFSALKANTTGANNTAMGSNALVANTTGAANTGIGRQALYSSTTASNNTAVGYQALYSTTTAPRNTAVGYQAGYSNTTSQYGCFFGYQAGLNSTGQGNTLFGDLAGGSLTTGQGNTFVGSNNAIGGASGGSVTTGSYNTILGSYNGNQGGLDIRTASNYIVLSDGAGNPRLYCNNAGHWYINAAEPCLDVNVTDGTTSYKTAINLVCAGSGVGSIQVKTTGTVYNTTSDYRLKDITGNLTGYKERLLALQPKQGSWKADGSYFRGFLVHEFAGSYPSSVSGEKDAVDEQGNPIYQSMQAGSSEVIADLVAYIHELETRLAVLEKK